MKKLKIVFLLTVLSGCWTFPSLTAQVFKYEWPVETPKDSGYQSILLPPFSTCELNPDFSDLRLYDQVTGKEVPYLFKSGDKRERILLPLPFEQKEFEAKRITSVQVGFDCPYVFDRVKIKVSTPGKFYRSVSLYAKKMIPAQGKAMDQLVTSGVLDAQEEIIVLNQGEYGPGMSIDIQNLDNPPLEIDSVFLVFPQRSIIALLDPSGKYVLRYGNPHLKSPEYDLRYYEAEINSIADLKPVGSPAKIFEDSPEKTPEPPPVVEEEVPWYQQPTLIWIVLIVVVALLGVMTVKMLKKS